MDVVILGSFTLSTGTVPASLVNGDGGDDKFAARARLGAVEQDAPAHQNGEATRFEGTTFLRPGVQTSREGILEVEVAPKS